MARNAKNREKDRQPKPDPELPLAGPHAKPELTDKDKAAGITPEPRAQGESSSSAARTAMKLSSPMRAMA
jgi:hypothetical protein